MALRIIKETDPITIDQLVLLIYGAPGIGKTSIAFTAEAPLLLDFDSGAHRSAFRRDSVPVADWEEVAVLNPADLAPYKTIIVDTGGRALDKITAHIVRTQPKLAQKSGALQLKGYGELKAIFTGWLKQLREMGKDVVLLGHDAEDKNGDDLIVRPDFQGSSRQEVVKASDGVAYMYRQQRQTILDFNPTDRWIGKNPAQFEPLSVPNFATNGRFLADVIQQMKDAMNQQTEAQRAAAAELANWQARLTEAQSVEDFNALMPEANDAPEAVRDNVKRLMLSKAKERGLAFDRQAKAFTVAA